MVICLHPVLTLYEISACSAGCSWCIESLLLFSIFLLLLLLSPLEVLMLLLLLLLLL